MSDFALIMAMLATFVSGVCVAMQLILGRWALAAIWTVTGLAQAALAFVVAHS